MLWGVVILYGVGGANYCWDVFTTTMKTGGDEVKPRLFATESYDDAEQYADYMTEKHRGFVYLVAPFIGYEIEYTRAFNAPLGREALEYLPLDD